MTSFAVTVVLYVHAPDIFLSFLTEGKCILQLRLKVDEAGEISRQLQTAVRELEQQHAKKLPIKTLDVKLGEH